MFTCCPLPRCHAARWPAVMVPRKSLMKKRLGNMHFYLDIINGMWYNAAINNEIWEWDI